MKNPLRAIVHWSGRWYIRRICESNAGGQRFRLDERPIAFRFLFDCLTKTMPVTVLDVGTGTTALPSILRTCGYVVTAIDNIRDYWPNGFFNQHWHVLDDDITRPQIQGRFDLVSCISVLEHINDHEAAVRCMFALLNPGGHAVITFPYNEGTYVENVYQLPAAGYGKDLPYICQVYSRSNIDQWLHDNDAELVAQEYWQVFSGEFWTFGERLRRPRQTSSQEPHQLTCLLLHKR